MPPSDGVNQASDKLIFYSLLLLRLLQMIRYSWQLRKSFSYAVDKMIQSIPSDNLLNLILELDTVLDVMAMVVMVGAIFFLNVIF